LPSGLVPHVRLMDTDNSKIKAVIQTEYSSAEECDNWLSDFSMHAAIYEDLTKPSSWNYPQTNDHICYF